jgi:hypothetical protein
MLEFRVTHTHSPFRMPRVKSVHESTDPFFANVPKILLTTSRTRDASVKISKLMVFFRYGRHMEGLIGTILERMMLITTCSHFEHG